MTHAGPARPENAVFVTHTQVGGRPWEHMPCDFTDTCFWTFSTYPTT